MRLAMVGSGEAAHPPIRGGAVQTYIQEVARLLAPRHEITLVGVCDDALPLEEVRGGIRYIRIKCRPNDPTSYARGLVQRMSRERFDVIEVFNRPLNVLPLHKACPGSRFVLSLHNEMFRESKIPRVWPCHPRSARAHRHRQPVHRRQRDGPLPPGGTKGAHPSIRACGSKITS